MALENRNIVPNITGMAEPCVVEWTYGVITETGIVVKDIDVYNQNVFLNFGRC